MKNTHILYIQCVHKYYVFVCVFMGLLAWLPVFMLTNIFSLRAVTYTYGDACVAVIYAQHFIVHSQLFDVV